MAGPGDEIAKAARGRGHLRASHADREQVIETLKAAFVHGMLAKDEFDLRVGQTFASRTYAELAAVIADIPVGLTTPKPPAPSWAQGEARIPRPGIVLTVATALYAVTWAFLLPKGAVTALVGIATPFYLIVVIFAGAQLAESRQKERSGGQSPPRRAAGDGARHSSACRQPTRASSSRRAVALTGTPPNTHEGVRRAHPSRFASTAPWRPTSPDVTRRPSPSTTGSGRRILARAAGQPGRIALDSVVIVGRDSRVCGHRASAGASEIPAEC